MNPNNRNALAQRVVKAAEAALAAQGYASAIDVLVGIGWLDAKKGGRVAARSDRLPRAGGAEQPVADIGGHEIVLVLGGPDRLVREPDELCRASTGASDVAVQPKR